VSAPVDRELVERLLQDESLSFREIARRAKCSDWSVRSIASQLDSDNSGDTTPTEPLAPTEWWIFAGIVALIFGGLCFASWRTQPPDGGAM